MKLETFGRNEWAPAVGARLVAFLPDGRHRRVCFATGSTPEPAYAAFAAGGGALDDTEVFLLDEFLLPRGDPGRCDEMLARSLLELCPSPPLALHTFDVSAEPLDDECRRYERELDAGGLDLAILGLGANGHIGMNEPGSAADTPTRVVDLHPTTQQNAARYGATSPPSRGITIGMRAVLAAAEIWLLVTGEHKAAILNQVLTGPIGPDVPASFLRDHPNAIVIADEPATIPR
ncbi:MAG: 6-phosphogluconolactonase [Acidimicrobiia bacterium]|nr:6-phosphogluconolactonase [Acidimicrobiia bacterium]